MGRSSFELHSVPNTGLFSNLHQQGHKIIKIVLSKKWESIPSNILIENAYLASSWSQVKARFLKNVEVEAVILLLINCLFVLLAVETVQGRNCGKN